jgi:hypothetical protein
VESKEPLRLEGKIRTILKTGRSVQRPLLRQRVRLNRVGRLEGRAQRAPSGK